MFQRSLLLLFSLLVLAIAAPTRRAWPSGSVTCGSNTYSLSAVKSAVSRGFSLIDDPIGSNSYPHTYNNYEGLKLWCSGESAFNEFPILKSGLYSGGSPGADRVVFSDNGVYCAVVTHTGASGDDFVSCAGD
ncbi:ribonuclease-domain-containing protein [Armillaria gallica]|uniref:Ribonuclease-domain-containing protein n=1 Tax=Armillaria gallica TaxID=47427 RepID=A0A2H3CRZ0_ARMGA|nr:ribonuclease-domain-containing protein [Armillaria gallica]